MAMASNLLPTISACGGLDGVSSSQLTIGFSSDKLLRRKTNLPARAYEPVAHFATPPPKPPAVASPWILKTDVVHAWV